MTSINRAAKWEDLPPLLTTSEVCYLLRCSRDYLAKLVGAGLLPRPGRAGRQNVYPRQALRAMAAGQGLDPWAASRASGSV